VAHALTVLQVLPALEAGGVERSTLEIGAALVAAGHRSLVASAGGRLVAALEQAGSEHVALDLGRKSLRTLRHVTSLRRLVERERPDIVHARSRLPAWIAHYALRGIQGPRPAFVTSVHGLNSPGRYSAILTRGERVICVSDTVRDYVLRHYPATDPARLRVIPRGVDPLAFPHGHVPDDAWRREFFAQWPPLAGGVLLTLPARGTRLKGHATAIELLAALRAGGIDARLLLLGALETGREGYLRELRGLTQRRGVEAFVVLSPPRADVRDVLSISTLVLQLSTQPEAFGRTAAEALSLGRPVLGFDHGGVGEILARHFPAGRAPLDDFAALQARARELILAPTAVPRYEGATLAQMQARTLAVYAELRRV
jgi:glycosyltransferase involved in cell wall biosynthesis